jgi:hypothetical protein
MPKQVIRCLHYLSLLPYLLVPSFFEQSRMKSLKVKILILNCVVYSTNIKLFWASMCKVKKVKIIIVGILVTRVKIKTMERAVYYAKTEISQT